MVFKHRYYIVFSITLILLISACTEKGGVTNILPNNAPVLAAVDTLSIPKNTIVKLDMSLVQAHDSDGDSLALKADTGTSYVLFDSIVKPDSNYIGQLSIPVYVSGTGS